MTLRLPVRTTFPGHRSALRGAVAALGLAGLLAGCSSGPAPAPTPAPNWVDATVRPDTEARPTPVSVRVLSVPHTVVAADGFVHVPYEVEVQNLSAVPVTVRSIEALNPGATGGGKSTVIATLSGPTLDHAIAQTPVAATGESTGIDSTGVDSSGADSISPAGTSPAVLDPGASAIVDIDAFVPMRTAITRIEHRVSIDWTESGAPTSLTFTGARTVVDDADPIVVAPPVRGPGWVVAGGCCQSAVRPDPPRAVDGTLVPANRFAIDLRRLAASGRIATTETSSTATTSGRTPVLAVGDATVSAATGDAVILDLGAGRYAEYTHLGDTAVHPGDRVHTGQVLGHLAATDGPRLGFGVVDRPSLLQGRGLPYEFTAFTGRGRVTDYSAMTPPFGDAPVPVDPTALPGPHNRQLPLIGQVLDFS